MFHNIKSYLFGIVAFVMSAMSAFGVTITYDLNGGHLPGSNDPVYQIEISENAVVPANPIKTVGNTNYIFTGWCDSAHYASVNGQDTCSTNRVGLETTGSKTLVRWTIPNNLANNTTYIAMWEQDKFKMDIINIVANDNNNDYFGFQIGAAGEFWIDWGDGDIERLTANLNTTSTQTYAHKYTGSSTSYMIRLGGQATAYNTSAEFPEPVISFGGHYWSGTPANTSDVSTASASVVRAKVRKIYGSLGQIFSGTPVKHMFGSTFANCTNLIGTDIPDPNNPGMNYAIPPTLFSGVSGQISAYMFYSTFYNCENLTGTIPANLFSGINGQPASSMFAATFHNCRNLTGPIPGSLFSGIEGQPADSMFSGTFDDCRNLTNTDIVDETNSTENDTVYYAIPPTLFSGIEGQPAKEMFQSTFEGCYNLNGTIPGSLFSGIEGQPASSMFANTFASCEHLIGPVPANLFSGISGALSTDYNSWSPFGYTFGWCWNLGRNHYIPPTLFAGIDNINAETGEPASNHMYNVFFGTEFIESCPSGTHQAITGFEDVFNDDYDNHVSCVDSDYLYCRKEFKYDTGAKKCVACDKSVETCPTFGAIYKCPDGYAGNSNSTECIMAYTITYHLNGGVNNQDNPSKYTDENLPIDLKRPTKDGYNFVGWCTDAELTDCSRNVTIDSGANEEYWAKWQFACPGSKSIDGWMNFDRGTFDLNGDGAPSLDECMTIGFIVDNEGILMSCEVSAMCAEEPEIMANRFGIDCNDQQMLEQMMGQMPACDYDTAGISYMTCRYNADTYNAAGERYTDCSTLVNVRNHRDFLGVFLPYITTNDAVSMYAGIFSAELKAKCIDSSAENPYSNPDDNYWDDYFGQDISSLISQIEAETITGSQAFGTLQSVEVCACKTVEVSVLSAPMCLIDFGHKTQKALSVKGSNGNVYYINLTAANPSEPIQLSSGHTLRIIAKSGVYEATDVISSGE